MRLFGWKEPDYIIVGLNMLLHPTITILSDIFQNQNKIISQLNNIWCLFLSFTHHLGSYG